MLLTTAGKTGKIYQATLPFIPHGTLSPHIIWKAAAVRLAWLQCSEEKGCEEHMSVLSQAMLIFTKEGEAADSKHLTYDVDSIVYNPAKRVIYIPQSLTDGCLNIYSPEGELVKSIPVAPSQNVVPLDDDYFRRGTMYMIKYMPNNKMGRKNPWIKIISR